MQGFQTHFASIVKDTFLLGMDDIITNFALFQQQVDIAFLYALYFAKHLEVMMNDNPDLLLIHGKSITIGNRVRLIIIHARI